MADRKKVRFDNIELPRNPRRWCTSGGRPPRSPFPRSDTDDWATKSVLSIDGGGIRGYSSRVTLQALVEGYRTFVILHALMEDIGRIEQSHNVEATSSIYSSAFGPLDDEICAAPNPDAMPRSQYRPCHYFDYIAGVGTGGIIAMMLGRYRMSVGEAMGRYGDMCNAVARKEKHKALKWLNAPRVKLVPAWASHNEDERRLQSDPKRCHTIVCGCGSKLGPLRSDASSNPPRSVNNILSQCVGAEMSREPYCDAKHFYNNPSRTVLMEVSSTLKEESSVLRDVYSVLKEESPSPEVSLYEDDGVIDLRIDLLSIGGATCSCCGGPQSRTCCPTATPLPCVDPRAEFLQFQMNKQSRLVHKDLSAQALRFDARRFNLKHYCRLDVLDSDLQDVGVNEWKPEDSAHLTRGRVEKATNAYLQKKEAANGLHDFATRLVDKRRLRAESLQWERWALGVIYRCPKLTCGDWNERFDDSVGLWAHMEKKHGMKHANERYYDRGGFWALMLKVYGLECTDCDTAMERGCDEYEAMGRTREPIVDTRMDFLDELKGVSIWGGCEERIAAAKKKREQDLTNLAKQAVARRAVEDWIGA
ncbi:MAG: hypothetical protein Q9175_002749 [Cornicularia normoerica]